MYSPASPSNPFALLMDPEAVFRTIEKSDRLGALRRQVCRPLDKPLIPRSSDAQILDEDDFDDSADMVLEVPAPEKW